MENIKRNNNNENRELFENQESFSFSDGSNLRKSVITRLSKSQSERLDSPYMVKFKKRPNTYFFNKISTIDKKKFWLMLEPHQAQNYYYFHSFRFLGFSVNLPEMKKLNYDLLSSWLELFYNKPIENNGYIIREKLFNLIISYPFDNYKQLKSPLQRLIVKTFLNLSRVSSPSFQYFSKKEKNSNVNPSLILTLMICCLVIKNFRKKYNYHLNQYIEICKNDFLEDESHISGSFYILIDIFEKIQAFIAIARMENIEVPAIINTQYMILRNIFYQFSDGEHMFNIRGLVNEPLPVDYLSKGKLTKNSFDNISKFSGLIKQKSSNLNFIIDMKGRNEFNFSLSNQYLNKNHIGIRELGNAYLFDFGKAIFKSEGMINFINHKLLENYLFDKNIARRDYVSQTALKIKIQSIFKHKNNDNEIIWRRQIFFEKKLGYMEFLDDISANFNFPPCFCVYFTADSTLTKVRSKKDILISNYDSKGQKNIWKFNLIKGSHPNLKIPNPFSPNSNGDNSILIQSDEESNSFLSHWSLKLF